MSRVRVAALALVNWKGVFYERYLLDPHVTALEGANGAGKTTVMIAAYVVLLPDMTRLRFTNLGESGATGGDRGIWGRLGESGRPAYAALELDVAGERVVLGVRLTRAAEPTVEPTAFIVSGLAADKQLSSFLLVRREDGDHVPELDEVKSSVVAAGASIEVFRATKDYFAALFERGITPLRLTGETERAKWNDLLRTSMTGGISRALGSELRGFLLREETGLAGTLSRMRENLDACRRTRIEVIESRQLEREISSVYEAGLAMFAAALHAERLADLEARQRVRQAGERVERAQAAAAELAEQRSDNARREGELAEARARALTEVQQLMAAGERRTAAVASAQRLDVLEAELATHDAAVDKARAEQNQRAATRDAAKAASARTLEAYDRASV
ncbi:MAG: chromosome partition protein MukB, partial [Polyangiales bacterium]